YLFCGAATGAGGVLMEHLAGSLDARLALVVDPALPDHAEWDALLAAPHPDPIVHTIAWLRALEARGVAPLLLRAELGDADALRAVLARARDELGALDGIFYAPALGAAAEYAPLATTSFEHAAADLARLDRELSGLRSATEALSLDFVLLQGSIVPAEAGSGVGAAAAAYALLDAWAQRVAAEGGGRWTSVGWDRWRMEGEAHDPAADGIPQAEAVRAFERIAARAGEPRIVAAPRDPAARAALHAAAAQVEGDAALHPRPALRSGYHPPETPAEESLAAVWRDLFGIGEIGVRDDFFQLGGHSLLAMQLVSRVRDLFQVELPLPAVFEAPTIAGLTEVITEALLLEVEGMSEDAAESHLGLHAAGRGGEAAVADASPHLLLAALDELSDEALDRLLTGDDGGFE
ncbi:MAG TPA: phosphopantetheine-binding protein, partial [Longimicrobium sp.]|nr:phosphopantetheine-binding protein [Longimicrobium sp.]